MDLLELLPNDRLRYEIIDGMLIVVHPEDALDDRRYQQILV